MSLRDVGREEEYFEYDYQDEERKTSREQHEGLDLLEEGKFCTLFQSDPFPVRVSLAVSLISQHSSVFLLRCDFQYTDLTWRVACNDLRVKPHAARPAP